MAEAALEDNPPSVADARRPDTAAAPAGPLLVFCAEAAAAAGADVTAGPAPGLAPALGCLSLSTVAAMRSAGDEAADAEEDATEAAAPADAGPRAATAEAAGTTATAGVAVGAEAGAVPLAATEAADTAAGSTGPLESARNM